MNKTVVVYERDDWHGEQPPMGLLEFRDWLNAHIQQIPEEYRDTAVVLFNADVEYDSATWSMTVEFSRPENPDEYKARLEEEGIKFMRGRAHAADQMRRLAAEYGYKIVPVDAKVDSE